MDVGTALTLGQFVQFIYDNWNVLGQTSLDGLAIVDRLGQPVSLGKAYVVSKTIYGNDLATDVHPYAAVRDDWKIFGIVARNVSDQKDVVIAIRGTATIWEWGQDAKFWPKLFSNVPGSGVTEDGFTDVYQSFSFTPSSPSHSFVNDLIGELGSDSNAVITGHSLGAALATLLALDLSFHSPLLPTVYTIASPRVGDLRFRRFYDQGIETTYRIVNSNDWVPNLPPPGLFEHVGQKFQVNPASDLKNTPPCNHHLSTYLHLLAAAMGIPSQFPIQSDCLQVHRLVSANPHDEP